MIAVISDNGHCAGTGFDQRLQLNNTTSSERFGIQGVRGITVGFG